MKSDFTSLFRIIQTTFLLLIGISLPLLADGVEPLDTDNDGYRNISTMDHLLWVSTNPSSWNDNFEMDNDIDAIYTKIWNDGKGFYPIGKSSKPFTGKFNGNGYKVCYLHIAREEEDPVGFFGETDGAEISNLGIYWCDIVGGDLVGSLIGYNNQSTVDNSYSTGSVNGTHSGGLIGFNSKNCKITNSFAEVDVEGYYATGGLVGANMSSSSISNCFSTGDVYGEWEGVGGLVGWNDNSEVINCYASGKVSGEYSDIGGLIGHNRKGKIVNSYSRGKVTDLDDCENIGGLVGFSDEHSLVENSFWDRDYSYQEKSAGGTGKTYIEMRSIDTYTNAGWDFDEVWGIDRDINDGYPYLLGLPDYPVGVNENASSRPVFQISKVWPNPFYSNALFEVTITSPQNIKIEVIDILGNTVVDLYNGHLDIGGHEFSINGSGLSRGAYFLKIEYGGERLFRKFIIDR